MNERARHPVCNKSNHPKDNQNRRDEQQHDGLNLSGESLKAADDWRRLSRLIEVASPSLVTYKELDRNTVQKRTVERSVVRLSSKGNGSVRRVTIRTCVRIGPRPWHIASQSEPTPVHADFRYAVNSSFSEKRLSGLRKPGNSSTLAVLSAESPHLTRYRLLQLQFKFS
jgi:hypothetical protein